MTIPGFPDRLARSLLSMLSETSQRSSRAHRQFLQHRSVGLQQKQTLIAMQTRGAEPAQSAVEVKQALFDSHQLDAFGAGHFSRCLGEAFRKYDGRNIPRIPNGDLKMMSRVMAISGTPHDFSQPAGVTVEYDVPVEAWFLRDNTSGEVPYALWMEIALQPCGFLSAYLDSYALVPHQAFYFRNLDGSARLKDPGDVRGQTLTTQARLISSVAGVGTVVQRFGFTVSVSGRPIFEGESTFGYFSVESMTNQVGLDGGKRIPSWVSAQNGSGRPGVVLNADQYRLPMPGQSGLFLPRGRLAFLKEALVDPAGGQYGQGYLYAGRPVDPQDWFFPYHFSGDPVMPGSLGVEAILEGIKILGLVGGKADRFRSPRFALANDTTTTWRYRGQITPRHTRMDLEIHLRQAEQDGAGVTLSADASVWVDGLRIYEVKNASVQIVEG
jgi:3-hydroxymyristoyl/3-hydroxydecanoyl-(acyl carrier protein) dehydratase